MDTPRTTTPNTEPSRAARRLRRAVMAMVLPVGLSLLSLGAIGTSTAIAQEAVQDRSSLVKMLDERFSERAVALGLASNGGLIEVFATGNGSTWTMLLTMPSGESRVLGEGSNWVGVPSKPTERAVNYRPQS